MPSLGSILSLFKFLVLGPVNSYGRNCLALKPSCIICASAHLPSLRLTVEAFGENRVLKSCLCLLPSPQPCHGSLIRKVLATWLFGMKMAGPLRGHAWPGDMPAPPSSQWQDLCRSVIVAALTSHSMFSLLQTFAMH